MTKFVTSTDNTSAQKTSPVKILMMTTWIEEAEEEIQMILMTTEEGQEVEMVEEMTLMTKMASLERSRAC